MVTLDAVSGTGRLLLMVLLCAGCAHTKTLDVRGSDGQRGFLIMNGEPGDFVGIMHLCVEGLDQSSKVDVQKLIVAVLRERAPHLTLDCDRSSTELLQVTYQSGYTFTTDSTPPSLGRRNGMALLTRR